MSKIVVAASMAFIAAASQTHAQSPRQKHAQQRRCTSDGLVHAEVSPAITKEVKDSIVLLEPGAQVREPAKLILPCGFQIDPRFGWNLMLTNGTEIRRYRENNAVGFAPAFGFQPEASQSYTLNYHTVSESELHGDKCGERLKGLAGAPQLCSGGFGTYPDEHSTLIAHFSLYEPPTTRVTHWVMRDRFITPGFIVAAVQGRVESIFFLPPPDAPGGTITLIIRRRGETFRAYLDTPKG